jgi:hypothetical protein
MDAGRSPEMPRRAFMAVITGGLLAAPLALQAQQSSKIAKIGILANSPSPILETLKQDLRGLGWVEGRTAAFEVRYTGGNLDRLPGFAKELVQLATSPAFRASRRRRCSPRSSNSARRRSRG